MNQQTKQNEQPAIMPAHALAPVPQGAQMAPVGVVVGGNAFGVLENVRLEPKSFHEAMVCAELAAKIQLGNVSQAADALARIMRGATLGLDAMTSIESIFLINNRTYIEARALHAVVLRSPLCETLEILEEQCTDKIAVVKAQRVGREARIFKFTIDEAIAVVGGPEEFKKKDNYKKDPKGMLIARALERACNREWPDVTKGFLTSMAAHDRDVVNVDARTGEVSVTQAGALPGTPARDFASELEGMKSLIDNCKAAATNEPKSADQEWKSARDAVRDWTAPEAFKKQATEHYEQARKAWKDSQKAEAKS